MTRWFTDRSRYTSGFHCGALRYLRYHAGPHGYGFELREPALWAIVGQLVHEGMEAVISGADDEALAAHMQGVLGKLHRAASALDWDDFLRDEQACLIEGLVWGWRRAQLDWFKGKFELIASEQEETLTLTQPEEWEIVLQSRPDMVCRSREKGTLSIHDWKTTSSFSENWQRGFFDDPQIALATVAVEERLGEPVTEYWIHGLLKGTRRKFERGGQETEQERQYNHLCYATVKEPNPPITRQTIAQAKGYWYDKTPIWQASFTQNTEGLSSPRWWASHGIDDETLKAQFLSVGPYRRPDHMIAQAMRSLVGEERRWVGIVAELDEAQAKHGWASEEFQQSLDSLATRSYACNDYFAGQCPMYRLCFKTPGWEDPLGHAYVVRRPHHAGELKQALDAGVPVPREAWEE